MLAACAPTQARSDWPAWEHFTGRFVTADGRVVDVTFGGKSTSEGQSYGLFLALVANRRDQFDRMLAWTSDNLAGGKLGARLPAWLWGEAADHSWGVRDENSASDADLWIAYSLLEAARLWQQPAYAVTARQLLALIAQREVTVTAAGLTVLLPGAVGFKLSDGRVRLNPSYVPGFVFSALAQADPGGPWQHIWRDYLKLAPQIFRSGIAPDNFVLSAAGVVGPDTEAKSTGSYDAIRVYLWAGMSGAGSADLRRRLAPFITLVKRNGTAPEKVDPQTGQPLPADYSPPGYAGALLPFLQSSGETQLLAAQVARVSSLAGRGGSADRSNYYDEVLMLFGSAWIEQRYAFSEQGALLPAWAAQPAR
jgi:endoglucanase